MKVKITDPGTNSAKRKRLGMAISEIVFDTYNDANGATPYTEGDVLYINPITFDIGICQKDDVPLGCHYHPIEEVGIKVVGLVSANPEYLEMIVNHYFPD